MLSELEENRRRWGVWKMIDFSMRISHSFGVIPLFSILSNCILEIDQQKNQVDNALSQHVVSLISLTWFMLLACKNILVRRVFNETWHLLRMTEGKKRIGVCCYMNGNHICHVRHALMKTQLCFFCYSTVLAKHEQRWAQRKTKITWDIF